MNRSSHSTSLSLIVITLLTGIALGWLLRDTFRDLSRQSSTPPPSPTAGARLPATQPRPAAPTTAPTAAPPSPQPTVTPQVRSTATTEIEPAVTPERQTTAAPPAATIVPATAEPPAATPQIAGYIGHRVAQGETLATIAAAGGSTPDLIASYNRLGGEPQPGRDLIVPQLASRDTTLESQPLLVMQGRNDKPWVALTLDAGAGAEPVPRMLQTLRERNVMITFFLTGKWIEEYPDLTRQIVADGHEIANHTYTHPDLTRLGDAGIRRELADTEALLGETAGASSRPLFRPPYGAYDEQVLRSAVGQGYLPIYWTLDSLDSVGEPKTPEFLLERVTRKLTPEQLRGAIILAHCGSAPTADALPQILDRFAEMGFEVRKVSEVLGG